ncbi:S24 family peptidase [Variovorax sp. GT1P44]|uniref:S24 family peptidase n=1 Tax=Variovorax sp. GT1P44 TaxID=3443742 RepID=UPI003F465731
MNNIELRDEAHALMQRFIGINRSRFARDHDIPGGANMIYQHINALRPISFEAAAAYAKAFGVPIGDISARFNSSDLALQAGRTKYEFGDTAFGIDIADGLQTAQRYVPVVGTARLGDDGHYYELEYPVGHGDGFLKYPSNDKNAYAVRCRGESMSPRIRHGEFAIIEPNHVVVPGDEVLVKSQDGRVMIKVLAYARDGLVHLDSINNNHQIFPRISLAEEDIAAMHYVAATAKSALWFEATDQRDEPAQDQIKSARSSSAQKKPFHPGAPVPEQKKRKEN